MLRFIRFRILFRIAGIALAMSAAYAAMHTTQGVMGVAKGEPPLPADRFRAPIATLEARLFAPAPLSMRERIELASSFDAMRQSLRAGSDGHLASYSAREIGTLAGMSRGLGNLGGADLDRVRRNWLRVRANTFDDASWFRFSEADPVAPAIEPRVALSDADLAIVVRLRATLAGVESAIGRGEREVPRLGEPRPSGVMDDGVADAWRNWTPGWSVDVERLRRSLPVTPDPDASPRVRFACECIGRAIAELSAVPGDAAHGGRAPYEVESTRHFQNARHELQAAKGWIETAEQGRPA